jgi:hypothetical protein
MRFKILLVLYFFIGGCSAAGVKYYPRDAAGADPYEYEADVSVDGSSASTDVMGGPPDAVKIAAKNGKECYEDKDCGHHQLVCHRNHCVTYQEKPPESDRNSAPVYYAPYPESAREDEIPHFSTAIHIKTLPENAFGYILPLEDFEEFLEEYDVADDHGLTYDFLEFAEDEEYERFDTTPVILETEVRTYKIVVEYKSYTSFKKICPIEGEMKTIVIVFREYYDESMEEHP